MVVEATGEKAGRAKGGKKCSQFIILCRCYSRYCSALECMDGGETQFPALWRVGGEKGGGKWRFLLK